nr:reverse transcriptase domain-containing protein [Tanacetum cinerariifolium]
MVGFGVDGVTIMDELVGGGERWCSGGVVGGLEFICFMKPAMQSCKETNIYIHEIFFSPLGEEKGIEGPIIIDAKIGGHCIHHMYVDGGSASEILYEHCFNRLRLEIKNQLALAITVLIGFIGKVIWPIRKIQLLVTIGDKEHSALAWMNFMVVRSPSLYNGIIRRPGVRKSQAVPSTAHGMLKIPVEGGIITLKSSMLVPLECTMVFRPEGSLPVTKSMVEERIKLAINPEHPEQTVMIGSTLIGEGHNRQAADRILAIQEEVEKLIEAKIIKEVHYQDWLSNPVMVKKHDHSWRMCVDFKDLNKAYPKDGYSLPEIDWKFQDDPFKDWCGKLCIRQHFASIKHPQTNGLVERENHSLGEGIKARLDARRKNWIEKLPHVLWAHRPMIKSSNGYTPFSLTYKTKAVIPTEIGMPTLRTTKVELVQNNEAFDINLDLLDVRIEEAAIHEAKSKTKMEKYYNLKL